MRLREGVEGFEGGVQGLGTFGPMEEEDALDRLDELRFPRLEDTRSARVFGFSVINCVSFVGSFFFLFFSLVPLSALMKNRDIVSVRSDSNQNNWRKTYTSLSIVKSGAYMCV